MGKVRVEHQKRPLDIRQEDEKTTEPFGTEKQWLKHPNKFDFECVDEALPSKFSIEERVTKYNGSIREYTTTIEAEAEEILSDEEINELLMEGETEDDIHALVGGTAAYLRKTCDLEAPEGKYCYINAIWVYPAFRYKCLSNVLLRETINKADRANMNLNLTAQPFDLDADDYTGFEVDKSDTEALVRYYKQFGFKSDGKMKLVDKENLDHWKQFMRRQPRKIK